MISMHQIWSVYSSTVIVHVQIQFIPPYVLLKESGAEEEYFSDEEGDEPDSKRRKTDVSWLSIYMYIHTFRNAYIHII